ncbi:YppE family protein [Neobacillus drentensis]|uniref:YppE family protein n=1 Tax=Neobacillus drentensis TaxID=220684 RepID=UPI002FFE6DD5
MSKEIIQLTEKLLVFNKLCMKYYQEGRETGTKHDFHKVIKPFANEVKDINEQWKPAMKNWLSNTNHKHLHVKQIDTTSEHIEQLSIQAFFPETSKTRFFNANRTVEYFLLEILKELKN